MEVQFKTISSISEGLYKEKGSKFISFAFPVLFEEDIKTNIDDLKKRFHDGRHHCYAWCLGEERTRYRENDDGEPSNSAGKPILGQINSHNLTNILIVVVRYFGGTKLGVGGLINAYRKAAADAIRNNTIIEAKVYDTFLLEFDYSLINSVMKIIKEHKLHHFDADFSMKCTLKIKVWKKENEMLIGKFRSFAGIKISEIQIK